MTPRTAILIASTLVLALFIAGLVTLKVVSDLNDAARTANQITRFIDTLCSAPTTDFGACNYVVNGAPYIEGATP